MTGTKKSSSPTPDTKRTETGEQPFWRRLIRRVCRFGNLFQSQGRHSTICRGMSIAEPIRMLLSPSPIVEKVIGCAIEVHRSLGPGLLESAYAPGLMYEWQSAGLEFEREVPVPVEYKGVHLACGYRVDFVVGGLIVVETKSIERLLPVHKAQMVTYLRLLKLKQGLLINFNVRRLIDGVRSVLN